MEKTFSLQNMETYFRNYIPCKQHTKQPITNFCTQKVCLRFLCPECVQNHSLKHANHAIQSIKTCIKKTSIKISNTIAELQNQTNRNAFLKKGNHQQYSQQLIKQLEDVRKSLIEEINSYFQEKSMQVKRQTSKVGIIQKNLENLRKQIHTAITELKMLNIHLFTSKQSVKAIKKANAVDYRNMTNHFQQKIDTLQQEMNHNIRIQMNHHKREQFRENLNHLIGIRGHSNNITKKTKQIRKNRDQNSRVKSFYPQHNYEQENIHFSPHYKTSYNYQPNVTGGGQLSADRILNHGAFKIDMPNYFMKEPFLHYFQVYRSFLHIIPIKDVIEQKYLKWDIIPLNINFMIPSYHRTIATEDGNIFIVGGTIVSNMSKSSVIYQYDPTQKTLYENSNLQTPRSSHFMLCHHHQIYIMGGTADNDEISKKCELFDPVKKKVKYLAPFKYATTNSTVCTIGQDTILKLGGAFSSGENSQHIQIYNINADLWGQINPNIDHVVKGEFELISCCGWAPLNPDQVFIFGGYNEQTDNQNSKVSFIIDYNKQDKQYSLKYINMKNLPIADGFWNPQGIVYDNEIYCIQNVDGDDDNDEQQDMRNLLIFNGKYWKVAQNQ